MALWTREVLIGDTIEGKNAAPVTRTYMYIYSMHIHIHIQYAYIPVHIEAWVNMGDSPGRFCTIPELSVSTFYDWFEVQNLQRKLRP